METISKLVVLHLAVLFYTSDAQEERPKKKIVIYVPENVKVIHHNHKIPIPVPMKQHHHEVDENNHHYIGGDYTSGSGDDSYWSGKGFGGWHSGGGGSGEYGGGYGGGGRGYSFGHSSGGGHDFGGGGHSFGMGGGGHSFGGHGYGSGFGSSSGSGGGLRFGSGFGGRGGGHGGGHHEFGSGGDHHFGSSGHSETRVLPGQHNSGRYGSMNQFGSGGRSQSMSQGVGFGSGMHSFPHHKLEPSHYSKNHAEWFRIPNGWQQSTKAPFSSFLNEDKGLTNGWSSSTSGAVEIGIGGKWYDMKGNEIPKGKRLTGKGMQIGSQEHAHRIAETGYGGGYNVHESDSLDYDGMNWR